MQTSDPRADERVQDLAVHSSYFYNQKYRTIKQPEVQNKPQNFDEHYTHLCKE